MIDWRRAPVKPFAHQVLDAERMAKEPFLMNFSEMGSGKSATCIHAACHLYEAKAIDAIVIAAPAQCKSIWTDPELGQIQKYTWTISLISHYYGLRPELRLDKDYLCWIVTSYEFLRQKDRLKYLIKSLKGYKTMLVADESLFLKSVKSEQTKSMLELSHECCRRYALNGTPHGGRLEDTFAQFQLVNSSILGCLDYYHFKKRYCVLGGFKGKNVVNYKNQEDYVRRTKPFVIRHLKEDCLDLPPKLLSHVTANLSLETWTRYKQMRDEMLAWLKDQASATQSAPIKAMRLSQLTSGFLGGLKQVDQEEFVLYGMDAPPVSLEHDVRPLQITSDEKLRVFERWAVDNLEANPNFRGLTWCRFRVDVERVAELARTLVPSVPTIYGGQNESERDEAKREWEIGVGPCLGVGNPHAGGFGVSAVSFHDVLYYSQDYSLPARQQSEDRCHRPGQKGASVNYTDLIAVGPEGQQTIDGTIIKALRNKEDLLQWTSKRWESALLID